MKTFTHLQLSAPALLAALDYSAHFTDQMRAAPDSLQALANRDPEVRAWLACERGMMLTGEAIARGAIAAATKGGAA